MNKILSRSSLMAFILITGLSLTTSSALAAPGVWSQFKNWVNSKAIPPKPEWRENNRALPAAVVGRPYKHKIDLREFIQDSPQQNTHIIFKLAKNHPIWLQISADGHFLEGNLHPVTHQIKETAQITIQAVNTKTKQASLEQVFILPIEALQINVSEQATADLAKLIPETVTTVTHPIKVTPHITQANITTEKSTPAVEALPTNVSESTTSTSSTTKKAIPSVEALPVSAKEQPSNWSKLNSWGKQIQPQWTTATSTFPTAISGITYQHSIPLNTLIEGKGPTTAKFTFSLNKDHPSWLQMSADGQYLEGNHNRVDTTKAQIQVTLEATDQTTQLSADKKTFTMAIDHDAAQPRWSITAFPDVAIAEKKVASIDLNQYVHDNLKDDSFSYLLTSGKDNPDWVDVTTDGQLSIQANNINPEDVNTTQVIYLTAISHLSGKSTPTEILIKVTTNYNLGAPVWNPDFKLPNVIIGKPYSVEFAKEMDTINLADNDEITFELANKPISWLQLSDEGISLITKNIPPEAADHTYEVTIRATSKMSGKIADFNGTVYVNPIPKPLEWKAIPEATIDKNYRLDLKQYLISNIKDDQITFKIDSSTLPSWLSIENNHILTGIPKKAELVDAPQMIHVTAHSELTGMTSKKTITTTVLAEKSLQPVWKKDFLRHLIVGESYRSDDLSLGLQTHYPLDQFKFEYVSGPDWIKLNDMCHCLVTQKPVPEEDTGKSLTIKLRVLSKASGQAVDYQQTIQVFSGVPKWIKNVLPPVEINQTTSLTIPLDQYAGDDLSGDEFDYQMDSLHSPSWMSLQKKGSQAELVIDSKAIQVDEVHTLQTVRLLATSQRTHKTSPKLLTIEVKPNKALPKPAWKSSQALPIFTVGVSHATDLNEYVHSNVANDHLKITLGPNSPTWLKITDNRLSGVPPRSAVGGPYPLTLVVHSQASRSQTVLHTEINVQLVIVAGDNMETHRFNDNHESIVIRGLKKNHRYRLADVKGSHFDYGPFYSPYAIQNEQDWNGNPFYAVDDDGYIETGDDGVVSIVYYTLPTSPAPDFDLVVLH